ncbi:MAG: M18 family aminopeptidase [Proteobacteria bacterium]|nr:M18 family aminopeptidase [Pseudomonadota bacterium]
MLGAMSDPVADLLAFIDRSPTPYHAVEEARCRLEAAEFRPYAEREIWSLAPGDRGYVVRNQGSLLAFEIGSQSPAESGFRMVGAHTDSPNLRLKPRPDLSAHGYRQLAVEPYGGVLLHTWLDRDLSLAGRVTVAGEGAPQTVLLDFGRPLLRVPNLAIHLQREVRTDGLKLNPQQHLVPLLGLEDAPPLPELLASELKAQGIADASADGILAFDLMTYDTQPSGRSGARGEFLHAPRLDNLASCHAAVSALLASASRALPPFTRVVVLYDHEEVGSRSAEGAAGTFLSEGLERLAVGFKGGEPQGLARALAASSLVSADMAHAVHPNYADRHEPGHRPVIGKGPVIKVNANQAYATNADTAGLFRAVCAEVDVEPQHFVSRSDLGCGSTIGPISAAAVGVPTVDVGNPMLSMHSCREMAGTADVEPMLAVLGAYFSAAV